MLRAQFTYTATARPGHWDSGAGWKVQSLAHANEYDEVPKEDLQQAVRNVGGFTPPALPELPSQADVDALPRCLRLDLLANGMTCVSHIVAAGPDYSGRPNFFAHGLVVEHSGGDYQADEEGVLRPADLWGADLWLRPLGAQAVDQSRLDAGLDRLPWGSLDGDALGDFLETRREQAAFAFAAFERSLTSGGSLVVVGDEVDSAAAWTCLFGQLLFPANAWRLPFSTYERVRDTTTPQGWRFTVVGVPASDATIARRLPGHEFAVLEDGGAPVRTGSRGWRLQDGSELVAGPWARLAEAVVFSDDFEAVVMQIEDLFTECGERPLEDPLWALGAAVLVLQEERSLGHLREDAVAVVRDSYPSGLTFGPMTEKKLRPYRNRRAVRPSPSPAPRVQMTKPAAPVPVVTATPATPLAPAPHDLVDRARRALSSVEAFRAYGGLLPAEAGAVPPAMRAELDEILGEALQWVPLAAAEAPRTLLRIAAFMDGEGSPAADRETAAGHARTYLVPALLDRGTNPRLLRWPAMPPWLWDRLAGPLERELPWGKELPGEALSEGTHSWLGDLSMPAGALTAEALAGIGSLGWERAAYRVFRDRTAVVTSLQRATAFLGLLNSRAWTEGKDKGDRARQAADEAFFLRRAPLSPSDALVLMACVDDGVPFAGVLAKVLEGLPPSADTAAAVTELRARETPPPSCDGVFQRHQGTDGGTQALLTDPSDFKALASDAYRLGPHAVQWVHLAEALLRVDVGVLPVRGYPLPQRTWDPDMPWDQGWQLLLENHPDPDNRIALAANLICRGERARQFDNEDWAADWLAAPTGRGSQKRSEWLAQQLVPGADMEKVRELVRRLVDEVAPKPKSLGSQTGHRDAAWRSDAVAKAGRLVGESGGSQRPFGRR